MNDDIKGILLVMACVGITYILALLIQTFVPS